MLLKGLLDCDDGGGDGDDGDDDDDWPSLDWMLTGKVRGHP